MWMVWIGTALVLMKWLEFGPVAAWSWWWVLTPLLVAFAWFEGLERVFGRDKRQLEAAEYERRQKERVAQTFKTNAGKK